MKKWEKNIKRQGKNRSQEIKAQTIDQEPTSLRKGSFPCFSIKWAMRWQKGIELKSGVFVPFSSKNTRHTLDETQKPAKRLRLHRRSCLFSKWVRS